MKLTINRNININLANEISFASSIDRSEHIDYLGSAIEHMS